MSSRSRGRNRSWTRTALWVIGILVVVFIVIQFIPYGHNHTNPPGTNPFKWTDPKAHAIAKRSCYDCHSNRTNWWWATKIAPMSWLVQHDVDQARGIANFSDWSGAVDQGQMERAIGDNMPPLQYTLIHPNAKLSAAERRTLLKGYNESVAAQQAPTPKPSVATTATPTPTQTASTADAVNTINQVCSACHSPQPALMYRAPSAADAQALIDQMIQQGASVSASQQQLLVDYYTR